MESSPTFPHRVDDNSAVWLEFKELQDRYGTVCLGEGAPAYNPPDFLVEELRNAIGEGHNQYGRCHGHPLLVQKVAEVYGRRLGAQIDPLKGVVVSAGAYNVICNVIYAMVGAGDEVLVFEPGWPCYADFIQLAGGVYRPLALEMHDGKWQFNLEQFKAALNDKTKLFIFNNAQNPTGKIFTREELESMTEALQAYPNVVVVSDDVYEFLAYDSREFIGFASVGSNFNRTITCFCPGKLFCATGWQVGWAVGPPHLIQPVQLITYATVYCANTPVQVAFARSLDKAEEKGYQGNQEKSYR